MEEIINSLGAIPNSVYLKIGAAHYFICKCGSVDKYTEPLVSVRYCPKHSCSACKNMYYLDVVSLVHNPTVIYWKMINIDYEVKKDKEGWVAKAILRVPLFNVKIQKVQLSNLVLVTSKLHYDSHTHNIDTSYENNLPKITRKYVFRKNIKQTPIFKICTEILESKLYDNFMDTLPIKLSWLKKSMTIYKSPLSSRYDIVKYFLKNQELNSLEFYYWVGIERFKLHTSVESFKAYILNYRTEKSLKKAFDLSYVKAIDAKYYDPLPDYVFSRRIKDVTLLLRYIEIPIKIKSVIFAHMQKEDIYVFLDFMEKYYTQSSMIKLWESIKHKDTPKIIPDIFRMLKQEKFQNKIIEKFIKPISNIHAIHHELNRINNLFHMNIREEQIIAYGEDRVMEYKGLSYSLPLTVKELRGWARSLRNCLSSYSMRIKTKQSIVYEVYSLSKELLYTIEIKNYKLIQVKAFTDERLTKKEMINLENWLEKMYNRFLKI